MLLKRFFFIHPLLCHAWTASYCPRPSQYRTCTGHTITTVTRFAFTTMWTNRIITICIWVTATIVVQTFVYILTNFASSIKARIAFTNEGVFCVCTIGVEVAIIQILFTFVYICKTMLSGDTTKASSHQPEKIHEVRIMMMKAASLMWAGAAEKSKITWNSSIGS